MKYRLIETKFWEDSYVLELSKNEKLFFMYLFTNSKVNLCGIYELSDRTISYTLGATLEEIEIMKKKFEKDGKYAFYNGWVYIINFAKSNTFSSASNIIRSFVKDIKAVPPSVLTYFFSTLSLKYISPIKNIDIVMDNVNAIVSVIVSVIVKEGSPYPSPYPRIEASESKDINSDEIAF